MEQLFRGKNYLSPVEEKTTVVYKWLDWLTSLGIFGLAVWLTGTDLAHFVTADEHNWVYRSGVFLNAFLTGNWAGTSVWLTPGVTTTWLGSLGLALYYNSHEAAINQPFLEWLLSFPKTRADLDILQTLRWVAALFNAGLIVLIYTLARRLWAWPLALLGTLLLLAEPHLLSVSRIIGHDALTTLFITAALLSFMVPLSQRKALSGSRPLGKQPTLALWLIFSGIMGGLAILSKTTALILLPFLLFAAFIDLWQRKNGLKFWLWALLLWGGAAWAVFTLVWPAVWVQPLGQPWAVIDNAFLSSAGLEDADIQPYWQTPDLGLWYYPINGAFKLGPLTTIGVLLAVLAGVLRLRSPQKRQLLPVPHLGWLSLFAIIFSLFMMASVKQSPRYILPVFPVLVFIAAWGWLNLLQRFRPAVVASLLGGVALLFTYLYAPYYFTYFNPLLGGAYTAPRLVRIGWGEGLDALGRWLESQPDARGKHLGVEYTATIRPFYSGGIDSPISPELDYVAFYIKQSQSGYPTPEVLAYFEQQGALHHVVLNGVDYAQLYQGPAMELVEVKQEGLPVAYRPDTIYAPIGQRFSLDLLWPADFEAPSNQTEVKLSLQGIESARAFEATAPIIRQSAAVVTSRHSFDLPADTPRDTYVMFMNDVPIGQVKARLMAMPPGFDPVSVESGQPVNLVGSRQALQGNTFLMELAWQGVSQIRNNYTIFVQLLDAKGERQTGVDVAPERGFTTLERQEVMVTQHLVPIPEEMQPGAFTVLVGLYYFTGDQIVNVGQITLGEPIILGE